MPHTTRSISIIAVLTVCLAACGADKKHKDDDAQAGAGAGTGAGTGADKAGHGAGGAGTGAGSAGKDSPAADGGDELTTDAGDAGRDQALTVWPNALSYTNSDKWLRDHHDELTEIRPKVLVLDVQRTGKPIAELVDEIVSTVAHGTRYHGYLDDKAPVFLNYEIDKVVDLRDPVAEYPSFWPPKPFDLGALYTKEFASHYGYKDPDDGHDLTLCEIFEHGLINEIWIAAEAGVRNIYEHQSYVQIYDDKLQPKPGMFSKCTNGCFPDPGNRVKCSVTMRIQELNKGRGVGCFTHAQGHALENEPNRIPYFADNANRFFYFGMKARYGIGYDRLYSMSCNDNADSAIFAKNGCLSFPQPNHLVFDPKKGGEASVDFTGFGQGCGDVHHTANLDWSTTLVAATACEGYGMGEGEGGADKTTNFTLERAHDLFPSYDDDCGGHWQLYLRQSVPGLHNLAKDTEGKPMKNWWTFWYY